MGDVRQVIGDDNKSKGKTYAAGSFGPLDGIGGEAKLRDFIRSEVERRGHGDAVPCVHRLFGGRPGVCFNGVSDLSREGCMSVAINNAD